MFRIIILTLLSAFCISCSSPVDSNLQSTVNAYVLAGDQQDAETLAQKTHSNFRVVWNGPGPTDHTVFEREVFLEKFRIKEWGGDPRSIRILDTEICNNYASVHVFLDGNYQDFESLYTLVKEDGEWKVLQESVMVKEST